MYAPTPVPRDAAQLSEYLTRELLTLSNSLTQQVPYIQLQTLHVAPTKTVEGLLVKADGTDWNPGSGAGVYCYRSGWKLLG